MKGNRQVHFAEHTYTELGVCLKRLPSSPSVPEGLDGVSSELCHFIHPVHSKLYLFTSHVQVFYTNVICIPVF